MIKVNAENSGLKLQIRLTLNAFSSNWDAIDGIAEY